MSWFEALILGLIQGLTEFLPVSSSGHLEIGQALFNTASNDNLTFATVVHAATVLSTMVVLRKEIFELLAGMFKSPRVLNADKSTSFQWNEQQLYILRIAVSMIPVFVIGVFFKDYVESLFGGSLLIVGCSLLFTALLLTFSYYAKPRQKETISYRDAFIIGLAQAVAVLPGVSRSGSTIATGLLLGNKKESMAQFSFLMVLVPILGIAFLDIVSFVSDPEFQLGISYVSLLVGFFAAFFSGMLACKFMIGVVKKGKLIYFALYCALVGLTTIIFSLL